MESIAKEIVALRLPMILVCTAATDIRPIKENKGTPQTQNCRAYKRQGARVFPVTPVRTTKYSEACVYSILRLDY